MKYIVTLKKTIMKTVVVEAANEDVADKKLLCGDWEFEAEKVETSDTYCGWEYLSYKKTESPVITCEGDLKQALGINDVERAAFKYTNCGCCYRATDEFIGIAGYAEGSGDAECPEHRLYFPFALDDWWRELEIADQEGCDLWEECNCEEWE